ncbi:MAG: hypothetical protein QM784_38150 [Polyangiaceae bacterium]
MKTKPSALIAGVTAFVGTLALFVTTGDVSAAESRFHSSICTYYSDDAGNTFYNGMFIYVTDKGKNVYCPVPSSSAVPHGSATQLNIHGFSSVSNASVSRACVHSAWSSGSECGTPKSWTQADGLVARSVDVSSWNDHIDWFPYLLNYVHAEAQLYGFWFST